MRLSATRLRLMAAATAFVPLLLMLHPASAAVGDVTEFPIPTLGGSPQGITAGADGALWFTERNGDRIGRITTTGEVTEFPIPTTDAWATSIALGPDGALWFTEQGANAIGRIATAGVVTEFPIPTANSGPTGIALGPDGALWFTEQWGGRIGRITTAGHITEYVVPTASSWPHGITVGPDGALWFTEWLASKIGRITLEGEFTEFPLAGGRSPVGIVGGQDGAVWFTEASGNRIGRLTTAGSLSEFDIPTASSNPTGIAAGPDGAMWFTEQAGDRIARIDGDGTITEYVVPTAWSGPHGIASGPDGNLWFTESSVSAIGRLELAPAPGGSVPVDEDPPSVVLSSPAEDAVFTAGQVVEVEFACDDTGGSGLESCVGTTPNGSTLDTSTPGIHGFTVTATDGAGNSTSVTHHYLVASRWRGRLVPPPDFARLRAGQTAHVRSDLGGRPGEAILEPGFPKSRPVDCVTGEPTASSEPAALVGHGFRSIGHLYSLGWKTSRAWRGTCRQLILPLTIDAGMTLRLTASFT